MPLDKRFQLVLWLGRRTGHAFTPSVSVAAQRTAFAETNARFGLREHRGVDMCQLHIPASDGAEIGARLHRPAGTNGRVLPVMLYFHGGGWVIGDVASYDGLMRFFARAGEIAIVAADYRLGPEHRFPRGHEDAFDAYAWLRKNASALELDAERIAVGGDSAGGGLAASIACYAEGRGLAPPAFAFLIYPSVDAAGRFPSRSQFAGNLPLTPASMDWFMKYALSDPENRSDPLLVPLDAPHPERHAPAYILAARYDPLVDEGRAYFERLRDAGVDVVYDLRPTLPHASVNLARIIPEAHRALLAGIEATAVALRARPAKVAAITGASSGIGRALALELAAHGYHLALADRDRNGLNETARLVNDRTTASLHLVDVADKAAVDAFAADALAAHGHVDVLINNAGVSLAGEVRELSVEEMAWLMDINFWGTVYGVKAFLPALARSPGSTIVNLSSVFGIIAPPGQAAYAASKFAIRGFSESLREELRGSVHVVTVHPGGIKTNIARSARIAAAADRDLQRRRAATFEQRMLTLSPQTAARVIVRGILRRSDRVLIGSDAVRIDAVARIFGPRAARLVARNSLRGIRSAAQRDEPAPIGVQ
jgi:acetyl esterase/lipase/short-subunit dehydrogenase